MKRNPVLFAGSVFGFAALMSAFFFGTIAALFYATGDLTVAGAQIIALAAVGIAGPYFLMTIGASRAPTQKVPLALGWTVPFLLCLFGVVMAVSGVSPSSTLAEVYRGVTALSLVGYAVFVLTRLSAHVRLTNEQAAAA